MARTKFPKYVPPVLSPAEKAAREREHLVRMTTDQFARLNEAFAEFAADVVKNPAHALEWSGRAFDHAGEHQLLARLLKRLGEGISNEALIEFAKGEAKSAVDDLLSSRSTSPSVNEMARSRASAWRKWLPIILPEGAK